MITPYYDLAVLGDTVYCAAMNELLEPDRISNLEQAMVALKTRVESLETQISQIGKPQNPR